MQHHCNLVNADTGVLESASDHDDEGYAEEAEKIAKDLDCEVAPHVVAIYVVFVRCEKPVGIVTSLFHWRHLRDAIWEVGKVEYYRGHYTKPVEHR